MASTYSIPFGTGNFITRTIRQIGETRKSALPQYENELHCNEIMLLSAAPPRALKAQDNQIGSAINSGFQC